MKVRSNNAVLRNSQLVDYDDIARESNEESDVSVVAGPEVEPASE